jgi:membrane protein DedA with SNARE-associated domain
LVLAAGSSWADSLVRSLGGSLVPWGYVIVFLVAAAESAAFVGLVIPGETLMLVAGYLAWRGDLDIGMVLACAAVGAVLGDSIGYEIGRHLGGHLYSSRIGHWVGRQRWDKARDYLRVKGGRAVFFGRFVAVVRALIPAVAGDAHLPYGTFLKWNAAGAVLWAMLHVGIGYIAGPSYQAVEHLLGRASLVLLTLLVVVAVVIHFRRRRARTANP